MNKTTSEAVAFINELLPLLEGVKDTEIVICPPFTLLSEMKRTLKGHDDIELGAQNFSGPKKELIPVKYQPLCLKMSAAVM